MEKLLNVLFVCHQLPERSFFYKNRQFLICARCTGILLGYFIGIIHIFIFEKVSIPIGALLLLPIMIDGGFQHMGKWKSTNSRRFITGILAGVGTDFLIYEIVMLGFDQGRQMIDYILVNIIGGF